MNPDPCNAGKVRVGRSVGAVLVFAVLVGCGAPGPLMPEQRTPTSSQSRPSPAPETYRVASGDTLYSIAFGYGLDWRKVARWNDIAAPYTIHVGDWVRLQPPPDMRPAVAAVETPKPAAESKPGSQADRPAAAASRRKPEPGSPAGPAADVPARPEPPAASPADRTRNDDARATAGSVPSAATRSVAGVAWRWPTEGAVARGFNAGASRKGILISGQGGQPIRAAADGEVVYSGNGLIGYGELIIIKHSERMLSAYAHNRERLVGEGERVRSGQMIARMGSNERNEQVLHFEIRQDGKPADPVNYLPRLP